MITELHECFLNSEFKVLVNLSHFGNKQTNSCTAPLLIEVQTWSSVFLTVCLTVTSDAIYAKLFCESHAHLKELVPLKKIKFQPSYKNYSYSPRGIQRRSFEYCTSRSFLCDFTMNGFQV